MRPGGAGGGQSGTGAELSAEDLSRPILRPSVKIDLEESREAAAVEGRVETEVTFRIYFFAQDRSRPKLDNLAMRQAWGWPSGAGCRWGRT